VLVSDVNASKTVQAERRLGVIVGELEKIGLGGHLRVVSVT
jgi:hypothetical protein